MIHLPHHVGSRAPVVTMHRMINVAQVRFVEYNRASSELQVEFCNGDVKRFMNVHPSVIASMDARSSVAPPRVPPLHDEP
jgi:hypothetical protein